MSLANLSSCPVFKSPKEKIMELHSSYGFQNDRDWNECVDIHVCLLQCDLINNAQSNGMNQWIIKEIAVYATGKCHECKLCKVSHCMMSSSLIDDAQFDKIYHRLSDKYGHDRELISTIKQSGLGFFGSLFSTDLRHDEYLCPACLTKHCVELSDEYSLDSKVWALRRVLHMDYGHIIDEYEILYDSFWDYDNETLIAYYAELDGNANEASEYAIELDQISTKIDGQLIRKRQWK